MPTAGELAMRAVRQEDSEKRTARGRTPLFGSCRSISLGAKVGPASLEAVEGKGAGGRPPRYSGAAWFASASAGGRIAVRILLPKFPLPVGTSGTKRAEKFLAAEGRTHRRRRFRLGFCVGGWKRANQVADDFALLRKKPWLPGGISKPGQQSPSRRGLRRARLQAVARIGQRAMGSGPP